MEMPSASKRFFIIRAHPCNPWFKYQKDDGGSAFYNSSIPRKQQAGIIGGIEPNFARCRIVIEEIRDAQT